MNWSNNEVSHSDLWISLMTLQLLENDSIITPDITPAKDHLLETWPSTILILLKTFYLNVPDSKLSQCLHNIRDFINGSSEDRFICKARKIEPSLQ